MPRRRDPPAVCAIVKWAFDIGAPWASFQTFGHAPPAAVLVKRHSIGTLANALPPGLNRGRRGRQIGPSLGFRGNSSPAVLAVLAYRMISYWRPTVPGVIA